MERIAHARHRDPQQRSFNRFFHADDFSEDPAVQRGGEGAAAREKLIAFFRDEDARLTGDYWSGGSEPDASPTSTSW